MAELRLKSVLIAALLLANAACSLQQQNGNDVRIEQPFVLSDQQWKITQQAKMPLGDRVCTVSSGELEVTQRSHNHAIAVQVETRNALDPGSSYKVLVGGHNYETQQGWFDAAQSHAIVNDMMNNDITYTETREIIIEAHPTYRDVDNKIPRGDFPHQYQLCEHFVE